MSKRNAMYNNQFAAEQSLPRQTSIEKDSETTLQFDFDDLRILGVFDDDVHVLGSLLGDTGQNDCVLVIKNKYFKSLLNQWLLKKKAMCKIWKHYCGVGSVLVEKYQQCGEVSLKQINENVDVDSKYMLIPLTVPMYTVTKCFVDIEHG